MLFVLELAYKLYLDKPNTNEDVINNFVETIESFKSNGPTVVISDKIRAEINELNYNMNYGQYNIFNNIWNTMIAENNLNLLFN